MTPMLAGLLKVAATDPKLKGLMSNVGQQHLHITGIDQIRLVRGRLVRWRIMLRCWW